MKIKEGLPRASVSVKRRKHGEQLQEQYSGYEVRLWRENWDGVLQVEFESGDGMVTAVPVREILSGKPGERLILADCKNGVPMYTKEGDVRYRLVAEQDKTCLLYTSGLQDTKFIEERTEGYEKIKEIVKDYTPEKVGEICHIDPEDLRKAAIMYAKADKAPICLLYTSRCV